MKLKTLILSTGLGLGGADQQVIELATSLIDRGYQVKIVSMITLGFMGLEAQSKGLDIQTLNMTRGIPHPKAIVKLIKIINEWQPHILHSHMFHANILARVVRLLVKIPVLISTAHSIDESKGESWREIAYKATDFLCDLTINTSKAGLERYLQLGLISKHKAKFIPNFVDINKFYFNSELRKNTRHKLELGEKFTWLAIGRFDPPKDYPTTIKAFALVLKNNPNTLLLIVGQGKLKLEVENLVTQLGIESNVRFLGAHSDVVPFLNAADAYLKSSVWEGMPMVLLEAAATNLSIVATDVGGTRETVLDGESGLLVKPKNPVELAENMQKIMAMPEKKRLEMGTKGREYVMTNYSTEKVITKWEELYGKLIEQSNILIN